MKLIEKIKNLGKRAQIAITAAVSTISMAAISCAASAAETGTTSTPSLGDTVATVGDSIAEQFNAFVNSLIPVMIAILMSGLGIYAVFSLIKFAKKIFNHVAG